jgi:hypothetical protein
MRILCTSSKLDKFQSNEWSGTQFFDGVDYQRPNEGETVLWSSDSDGRGTLLCGPELKIGTRETITICCIFDRIFSDYTSNIYSVAMILELKFHVQKINTYIYIYACARTFRSFHCCKHGKTRARSLSFSTLFFLMLCVFSSSSSFLFSIFFGHAHAKKKEKKRKMPLANKEVVHLKNGWEKIQVRKSYHHHHRVLVVCDERRARAFSLF